MVKPVLLINPKKILIGDTTLKKMGIVRNAELNVMGTAIAMAMTVITGNVYGGQKKPVTQRQ